MSSAPFELVLETGEAVRVLAFSGRERVSRPFAFDIEVVAAEGLAYLERRASLLLRDGESLVRQVHGRLERVHTKRAVEGLAHARVRLAPRLARLGRRRARRVFQDKTTLDILEAILADWGLPHHFIVGRSLPKRPYSVQYDETDLGYVERLLAEDGLFYGFEHDLDASRGDVLLVADRVQELASIDGDPRLLYEPTAEGATGRCGDNVVTEVVRRERALPKGVRVRGYDHRRPRFAHEEAAGAASLETLDYDESSYEDDLPLRPSLPRLEAVRARALSFDCASYCRRLEPLRQLVLEDAGGPALVRRVEHQGYGGERVPDGKARYQNRAELLPLSAVPRPRLPSPRPRQASESAIVVGPEGSEIHTDDLGRIKVRFHWDRLSPDDDTASCWLRVLTPWAGAGWGTQFTPRVGMEVLVLFIAGDLDRPVCAGSLPNAVNPTPFGGLLSGMRSQSSPGGGNHNELSFDDARGAERFLVHAARDMDERVGNTKTVVVGGPRTTHVHGYDHCVFGDAQRVSVAGEREIEVGKADHTIVRGPQRLEVTDNRELTIDGTESHAVGQDRVLEIHGRSSTLVGRPNELSHREDFTFGTHAIGADERIELRSMTSIVLQCGESSLELEPDRIVLRSPTLELVAADVLRCVRTDGPSVTLGVEAEVLAKALRVFTDGATLELDQDVKTKGAKIHLGYDPSKPTHEADDPQAETEPLRLLLSDADFRPHADCAYHLTVSGRRFEGKTAADGTLGVDIPKGARSASLRLWERDYPTGPHLLYDLELGPLPAPTTHEGMKVRLRNLGYFDGSIDEHPSEAFEEALRGFQEDHHDTHELEATGGVDGPTQGALEDVHGG
jgi:type VI secretion system secreted protein VgrG